MSAVVLISDSDDDVEIVHAPRSIDKGKATDDVASLQDPARGGSRAGQKGKSDDDTSTAPSSAKRQKARGGANPAAPATASGAAPGVENVLGQAQAAAAANAQTTAEPAAGQVVEPVSKQAQAPAREIPQTPAEAAAGYSGSDPGLRRFGGPPSCGSQMRNNEKLAKATSFIDKGKATDDVASLQDPARGGSSAGQKRKIDDDTSTAASGDGGSAQKRQKTEGDDDDDEGGGGGGSGGSGGGGGKKYKPLNFGHEDKYNALGYLKIDSWGPIELNDRGVPVTLVCKLTREQWSFRIHVLDKEQNLHRMWAQES